MNKEKKQIIRKCLRELYKTIKQSEKVVEEVKKEMKLIRKRTRINIMKLEGLI